jgi:nucleoside-diphosphate-sugar epimerase
MEKSVSILGCGWLGLPLAEHLINEGCRVKGSTTSAEKVIHLREKGIDACLIDLSQDINFAPSFLDSALLIVTVPPRSRTQQPGVYLSQMKALAGLIAQHTQIKQLVYTSSTSVYPDQSGWVKEEAVCLPSDAGQKELVEVENLFLAIPNIAVTILRLGGLTGGSRLLVLHFAGRKELSGGNYPVNLLHLKDAISIIQFVVEKNLTGVFNACSPEHPCKKDFYVNLAERFQMPLPEFKHDQQEGKAIDVSKLEKEGYLFIYKNLYAYTYDQDSKAD